jgi:hypothetical protein
MTMNHFLGLVVGGDRMKALMMTDSTFNTSRNTDSRPARPVVQR